VPDSALEIYAKAEGFRRDMGNLDLIVNMYNNVQVRYNHKRPLPTTVTLYVTATSTSSSTCTTTYRSVTSDRC
jgi:hypothetical protein